MAPATTTKPGKSAQQSYRERLEQSTRSRALQAAILALLAASGRWSLRPDYAAERFRIIHAGSRRIAREMAPFILRSLPGSIAKTVDLQALTNQIEAHLAAPISGYVEQALPELAAKYTGRAFKDALANRVVLIVASETQQAFVAVFRSLAGDTGTLIRKTTSGNPCPRCIKLAGEYEAPWPDDVWDVPHPNCLCSFRIVHTVQMSTDRLEVYSMALTKDGLPASSYLVVDKPDEVTTWHLPIRDPSGKPDHGLMGAAHAALTAPNGYRGNKYDGPSKSGALAKLRALYKAEDLPWPDTAASANDPYEMVERTGLIFRAAEYADKAVTVTDADLATAVANFTAPLDAELEHINTAGVRTFLDGKLGQLTSVWAKGSDLYGKLLVPKWMDPLWAEFGRKVSVVWNDKTKSLRRIGLVLNPRVEEATVMSAYTAFAAGQHDTPHATDILQQIHDLAATAGAICQKPEQAASANMGESEGMQRVHDTAVEHGAICPGLNIPSAPEVQQFHVLAQGQAPQRAFGAGGKMVSPRRFVGMRLDSLKFWRSVPRTMREEARDQGIQVPEEEVFSAIDDEAAFAAEEARREQLAELEKDKAVAIADRDKARQELFAATAQRLQGEAAAFADGLITGNKLYPAERESFIASFTQAGMDDATPGNAITFASGATGSRIELIKAQYAARPAHGLTKEQIDARGNLTVVMSGDTQADGPDGYSHEKLLSMTDAGKKFLSMKKHA
jgi:hypothetical protein